MFSGDKMKYFKYLLIILSFSFLTILFVFVRNRNVKLYKEFELYSSEPVSGLAWLVISSPKQASILEEKQGIKFPEIDFNKNFLVESKGRKIRTLKYRLVTKYLWDYNIPMGTAEFYGDVNPNSIYVYIIDKHNIKQKGD